MYSEPNSLSSIAGEWVMNEDGWAVDSQGGLLFWVPPELRGVLMWPRTRLLISRKGWLRLSSVMLASGAHGRSAIDLPYNEKSINYLHGAVVNTFGRRGHSDIDGVMLVFARYKLAFCDSKLHIGTKFRAN
ncbi:hypothetical protein B0J17DRAFT_705454, partial [Rhizoctonia solani]